MKRMVSHDYYRKNVKEHELFAIFVYLGNVQGIQIVIFAQRLHSYE